MKSFKINRPLKNIRGFKKYGICKTDFKFFSESEKEDWYELSEDDFPEEHKKYVKNINRIYMFDANMGTRCCELAVSYYCLPVYLDVEISEECPEDVYCKILDDIDNLKYSMEREGYFKPPFKTLQFTKEINEEIRKNNFLYARSRDRFYYKLARVLVNNLYSNMEKYVCFLVEPKIFE